MRYVKIGVCIVAILVASVLFFPRRLSSVLNVDRGNEITEASSEALEETMTDPVDSESPIEHEKTIEESPIATEKSTEIEASTEAGKSTKNEMPTESEESIENGQSTEEVDVTDDGTKKQSEQTAYMGTKGLDIYYAGEGKCILLSDEAELVDIATLTSLKKSDNLEQNVSLYDFFTGKF